MTAPAVETRVFTIDYDSGITTDAFGFGTARIYREGILIALASRENAPAIVEALRYANGER